MIELYKDGDSMAIVTDAKDESNMKLYRPSNGTEGMCFMDGWCAHCHYEQGGRECKVLMRTLIFDEYDDEYPREWCYRDGVPVCTRFKEPEQGRRKLDYQDHRQSLLFDENI